VPNDLLQPGETLPAFGTSGAGSFVKVHGGARFLLEELNAFRICCHTGRKNFERDIRPRPASFAR